MDMEDPNQYTTLPRAAHIAGLPCPTRKAPARPPDDTPPWLQVARVGQRDGLTMRRWLHDYLTGRDETNTHAAPLPEGYQAPE